MACFDTNAGAFYLATTNSIGLRGRGFVMDKDRGFQVWNMAAYQYLIEPSDAGESRKTINITYSDIQDPAWDAHPTKVNSQVYDLDLDLDAQGNIIGGDYYTFPRPDFVWNIKATPSFSAMGYMANLGLVYDAAGRNAYIPNTIRANSETDGEGYTYRAAKETQLRERTGDFGLESVQHEDSAWVIDPETSDETNYIRITISRISTEVNRNYVKIYEHSDGSGPLVASLHGTDSDMLREIVVKTRGAMVRYSTNVRYRQSTHHGFRANYDVIPRST